MDKHHSVTGEINKMDKLSFLQKLISPPVHQNYERSQRAVFMHYSLLIIIVGLGMLAILNKYAGANLLSMIMGLGILIFFGIMVLNKKGYFRLAGLLLLVLLYTLMTYNLIDGLGLHDPGILAFPAFILITAYLFGKKSAWVATGLSISSVSLVFILSKIGWGNFLIHNLSHSIEIAITINLLYLLITFIVLAVYTVWEQTLNRLNESYDKTLQGWAQTLEYRDLETKGHSLRAETQMFNLATAFGFNDFELEMIKRGALLHDIGKLAIPDRILLKAGPLTDNEREIMEKHTIYAKKILEQIPFMVQAMNIPQYHHENWDGSGYPEGLKGENIPLEARLFSVVDNWDALLSDRPYRNAWPQEKVIKYLMENSGKKFDPKVVTVFMNMVAM
ncbi:MAG TPA: hypothetical protein DCX54_06905 [Flavobacteriales bacterium]|nr:hypothetical protein [Flavobacteriales bacterium]